MPPVVDAARQATEPDAATSLLRDPERTAESSETGWWRLPNTADYGYLWEYLTYHLQAAELAAELDQVCCDLRVPRHQTGTLRPCSCGG